LEGEGKRAPVRAVYRPASELHTQQEGQYVPAGLDDWLCRGAAEGVTVVAGTLCIAGDSID
jgi:hypothetical protein